MTEDNADKTLVSQQEIDAVEAEIRAKANAEMAEQVKKDSEEKAKEIEARIRKEYEEKTEKEKLAKKLKEQEDALTKANQDMEAKLKAQQEAFEKRLAELEGQRKGVVDTGNPFKGKEEPTIDPEFQRKLPDGKIIDVRDPKFIKESQEESRKAYMDFVGIKNPEWGLDPNENRLR